MSCTDQDASLVFSYKLWTNLLDAWILDARNRFTQSTNKIWDGFSTLQCYQRRSADTGECYPDYISNRPLDSGPLAHMVKQVGSSHLFHITQNEQMKEKKQKTKKKQKKAKNADSACQGKMCRECKYRKARQQNSLFLTLTIVAHFTSSPLMDQYYDFDDAREWNSWALNIWFRTTTQESVWKGGQMRGIPRIGTTINCAILQRYAHHNAAFNCWP